jgi:1,4-dihydroxy-2-naphthoyl-CoA synthase
MAEQGERIIVPYGDWQNNIPEKTKKNEIPYIEEPYVAMSPGEFDFQDIIYAKEQRIATIAINRPHRFNTYRIRTLREMNAALKDALIDDEIGVINVTGVGDKAFCTGGDVIQYSNYFGKRNDDGSYPNAKDYRKYLLMEFGAFTYGLVTSWKPTIARINGIVVGGGNEVQMACDLSIAAIGEGLYISQVGNEVGSVAAGGATQWLAMFIGDRRAKNMLLRTLDAKISMPKAEEWGLINEAVPPEELDNRVLQYATDLLNRYPDGNAMHKALMPEKAELWAKTYAAAMELLTQNFQIPGGPADTGFYAFANKLDVDFEAYRRGAPRSEIFVPKEKK